MALPSGANAEGGAEAQRLLAVARALPGWLERRLFGMPPAAWLAAWQPDRGAWLERWCAREGATGAAARHVVAWLAALRAPAQALAWPMRPLEVLAAPELNLGALASAVAADRAFAERPLWRGEPAETGPATRHGRVWPMHTAWDRLGARLADVASIACDCAAGRPALALGALTLAPGEGIAYTEMARGLLVHWVRLEDGMSDAGTARVARYHVLAPTEWNFHPQGGFAHWLRQARHGDVRLAASALDPCVQVDVEGGGDA
jgi:hypothetical protein